MTQHNLDFSLSRLRPAKSPAGQFFRADPQPASVPHEQLQPVALCITKQEHMATERRALQAIAHQTIQAFESFAHIGRSHRKIDPRRWTEAKHSRSSLTPVSGAVS